MTRRTPSFFHIKNDSTTFGSIKNYLDANFKKDISIYRTAKWAGISESKLKHEFSAWFGKPFPDYIRDLRIAEGKRMLEASESPIKVICNTIGYKSRQGFTEAFKKMIGKTPLQYRNDYLRELYRDKKSLHKDA